ncbi:uncharacterized protein LOC119493199 [Sebastes umbrosus]|uniref:uncharacterized protein LOC119493199 n=1 Tax=Sebastes umbrosus TaxID=72105 RepID=UPI00189F15A8|nr:uncharacterized protein LOC119493199 [Sebastes umbrosus]
MRMTDMKSDPVKESSAQYSDDSKSSDAQESDSDIGDNVDDNPGQEVRETKPKPKVSIAERTVQTPCGEQKEMDRRQSHVISVLTDGAGCCEPQDSEKEQFGKLCSGVAHSCVHPPESNRHLRDQSIPNSLLQSAHVNTWNICATMDRAVPYGLSLAAPVRTPGTPGFPIGLQQHAPVQDLVSLSHFGGFLFYPYSSFSAASAQYLIPPARSRVDFRAYPGVLSRDYFTSPMMSSPVPALGGGGLKYLAPDLLMLPKTDQQDSVDEAEIDCSQDESQTR